MTTSQCTLASCVWRWTVSLLCSDEDLTELQNWIVLALYKEGKLHGEVLRSG